MSMGGSKRSTLRWRCEPLEGRQLLSGLLVALQAQVNRPGVAEVAQLASTRAQPAGVAAAATATTDPGVYVANNGPNAGANLPASPLLGTGAPTTAEQARERFVAHFGGPMVTLAPRFTSQSKILYLHGLGGSSPKFFLHGDYALAMAFPAGFDPRNPGGTYNAETNPGGVPGVTGFAFLDDKNNNSGGTVGLDLSADPTSFDAKGRPTRLFFTSDPNIYSGIFYVSQSEGVATIKYGRNTASTTFNGRLYTSGLTSPFQNVEQYAQHSG